MDFETRLARFNEHVDRRPRTNMEGFRAFLLHANLYLLGVVDDPPPEATYRALTGAYAPQTSAAPFELEQLGLLVESAWALVDLKRTGGTEIDLDADTLYGVLTPLPEDFIYREMLFSGGIDTVEALRGTPRATLTLVDGIGDERAEDVHLALANLEAAETGSNESETPPEGDGSDDGGEGVETDAQPPSGDAGAGEGGGPEYLNPADPYSGPHAAELGEAGYATNGDVFTATDADLTAISGVAKGKLAQIRAHFGGR